MSQPQVVQICPSLRIGVFMIQVFFFFLPACFDESLVQLSKPFFSSYSFFIWILALQLEIQKTPKNYMWDMTTLICVWHDPSSSSVFLLCFQSVNRQRAWVALSTFVTCDVDIKRRHFPQSVGCYLFLSLSSIFCFILLKSQYFCFCNLHSGWMGKFFKEN